MNRTVTRGSATRTSTTFSPMMLAGLAALVVVSGCAQEERSPVGVPNPAEAYCTGIGHKAVGEQCQFADGSSCEQWSFYRGECGQPHSYCARQGGTISKVSEDQGGWTATFAKCSLPGGTSCSEESLWRNGSCASGPGVANPSIEYCVALGYTVAATASDSECVFPDGTRCAAWSFYRGQCGQAHSYCETHDGSLTSTVADMGTFTATFATCTLPSGATCPEDAFWRAGSCG